MNLPSQKRILLADNSEDYRRSLKGLLELENYTVELAMSVQQALEILESTDFDLIIVDLRLTDDEDQYDISGYEVAKRAQKLSIPCVFVSGFTTLEYQRIALRSRGTLPLALDFIEKQRGPQAVLDDLRILFSRKADAPILESSPDLSIDLDQGLVRIKG
ncbi:MAG TPA: response regulator, partial [Anaerolineales bacterium]|nr:response regulator [Anaerolineales bacterium]